MAARLGDPYDARNIAPDLLDGFDRPACDAEMTEDQWGACISGYAPIRNSIGRSVGLVGVDLLVPQLHAMRRAFHLQCILVIAAVVLTALLASIILSRHINQPVKALHGGIQHVAAGDLSIIAFRRARTSLSLNAPLATSATGRRHKGGCDGSFRCRASAGTTTRICSTIIPTITSAPVRLQCVSSPGFGLNAMAARSPIVL